MPRVVFLHLPAIEFPPAALDSVTNNSWHHGLMSVATQPTIWLADPIPSTCKAWLSERSTLVDGPSSDVEAVVVRTATQVDRALLELMPQLRCVGRAGVGVDHIDLKACTERGLVVVNTPEANTESVVEYAIALLLDAVRPRADIPNDSSHELWESSRRQLTGGRRLAEHRIGILGFGRIGQRLGKVLQVLGAEIAFHDLKDESHFPRGFSSRSLEDLFAWSDIVSVHVDGRSENRGLVTGELLESLGPSGLLLNTSRGWVINTRDLQHWLAHHPQARAILDVHEEEPVPMADPLRNFSNARLLPHLASRTESAVEAMGWVVRDVMAVLTGSEPNHRVC